ncbi:MAG: response regulator transcription factor [Clostridium sp.]|jgi:DNA-binding response OmpR family regulator|nr:response regulator transcription factor [Clostridium sp.]
MYRILICEDEASIRTFLKINFERSGFSVYETDTGEEAVRIAKLEKPDVAILDVMLPGIDGFEVLRQIREENEKIGIIMLTAKGQDTDKIVGLKGGADDYIIKPFNPTELILRTQGLLRRINEKDAVEEEEIIRTFCFELDNYSQTITKNESEIVLTPKEFLLMKIFMENPGKAFTRDDLLNLVWGYDFTGDPKIVDVNVRRLRSKIEDNPSQPNYIETIWGTGYRWKKE